MSGGLPLASVGLPWWVVWPWRWEYSGLSGSVANLIANNAPGNEHLFLGGAFLMSENPMRPDLEILTKVSQYLDHRITLSEFEEWIVSSLSFLVSLPPSTVQELVATVELGLAEMSNGSRTEDEFRDMLQNFVRAHPTMEFDLAY
jgi:hypothetical protein